MKSHVFYVVIMQIVLQEFRTCVVNLRNKNALISILCRPTELGTFEWWISGLILDLTFFLISRLNNACSPLDIYLQIN